MLAKIFSIIIPLIFFYSLFVSANNLPKSNLEESFTPSPYYESNLNLSSFPEKLFEDLKLESSQQQAVTQSQESSSSQTQEETSSETDNPTEAIATSSPTPTQPDYTPIPTLTKAFTSPTPTKPLPSKNEGKGDFCSATGGTWKTFGSSCVDSCLLVSNPMLMCLQVISEGCDCGTNKCWDGASCVPNPQKESSPSPTPSPTSTDSPKQAPLCGNNICEEGEADFSDCPICSDSQDICPLRPCIFKPGTCPSDCS